MGKNDWLIVPKPVPCLFVFIAIPVYLIIWLFMRFVIVPAYPRFAENHLLAKQGEFFGPDAPFRLLKEILIILAVLAALVFLWWAICYWR